MAIGGTTVRATALGLALALAGPVAGQEPKEVGIAPVKVGAGPYVWDSAEQHDIRIDILARGLAQGYALAFLPDGDALIVERGARLRRLRGATGANPTLLPRPIAGAPTYAGTAHIDPEDVLGIQDVALHPDFATNHLLYYTYNRPAGYDPVAKRLFVTTVLARARLNGMALEGAEDLVVGETVHGAGGSRILFGPGGALYVSVGALSPGDIASAQRTDTIYGKVLRLTADGRVPPDNPFVGVKGSRPEIYTYGHRDPLGLAIDPRSGSIVASEHGPQGGDELNILLAGRNYGWPTSTYGTDYAGSPLPAVPVAPGTQGPAMIWMPGIAPNGIAFYTADRIPAWKNTLFIASARRGEVNGTGGLVRVVFNGAMQEIRQETLLGDLHQRFKDVRQGPDGLLYALTDEPDSVLLRISPAPAGRPVGAK